MNKINEMIKIAAIHVEKIELALKNIKDFFPIDGSKIINLSEQEMLFIELLINRFAKLQDYIGRTLINEFLKTTSDYEDQMTMIDKINKLERLNIIENAELWADMREARNHIAHEYPDHPELSAMYLNQIFFMAPKLIGIFNNMTEYAEKNDESL